jgi:hypothetical protein
LGLLLVLVQVEHALQEGDQWRKIAICCGCGGGEVG